MIFLPSVGARTSRTARTDGRHAPDRRTSAVRDVDRAAAVGVRDAVRRIAPQRRRVLRGQGDDISGRTVRPRDVPLRGGAGNKGVLEAHGHVFGVAHCAALRANGGALYRRPEGW